MIKNNCIKDEIMIDINNVSMRFNLGIEKGFSFKQFFIDLFNTEKRKSKKREEFYALSNVDFKVKSGEVELENVRTGEKEIISIEKLLNKFSK